MTLFLEPSHSPDPTPRGATVRLTHCGDLSDNPRNGEQKLNNLPESAEFDEDATLEKLIHIAKEGMDAASTPNDRRFWFRCMQKLIADRSPAQVARMEREMGLI